MCLVEIEKLPKLQTACTTQVGEGMVVHTETRKGGAGAQEHARVAACQSSAGLPGLRRRRRVRVAGHDVQVRRVGIEVHRHQEPPRRAAMVAGRVLRPPALHSVLSLHTRLRRGHGRVGAGHPEPRPEFGHRSQQRRPPRVRRVRHVHRHLPGRRTHLGSLPLQDAPVGDEPRRHRLHALRRWLPDDAWLPPQRYRHGDRARRQSRQERHQRRFPLHQGTLRLRLRQPSRAHQATDGAPRWQICSRRMDGSDRDGRPQLSRDHRAATARRQSALSAPTAPRTKKIICFRSSRAWCWEPTTSTITARRITRLSPKLSPKTRRKRRACAMSSRRRRSC